MNKALDFFIGTVVVLFLLALVVYANTKNEVVTCNTLKAQSVLRNFYVTQAEYEMCKVHGMDFSEYVIK